MRKVVGIIAFEFGLLVVNVWDEEPAAGHCRVNLASMIAYLRGTLLEKHPNQVIVETNGVGYDVAIPVSTFSTLGDLGAEVKLRVHTHVREDAILLFGFHSTGEKTLFEKLISVSGIGPKLAIAVLSGLAVDDLAGAIRRGEIERLVKIPGVGKKTAERIVLELRDKLEGLGTIATAVAVEKAEPLSEVDLDVLSALMNLGCNRPAAEGALKKAKAAGAGEGFEPVFRRALESVR